jgi:hypothetical protein
MRRSRAAALAIPAALIMAVVLIVSEAFARPDASLPTTALHRGEPEAATRSLSQAPAGDRLTRDSREAKSIVLRITNQNARPIGGARVWRNDHSEYSLAVAAALAVSDDAGHIAIASTEAEFPQTFCVAAAGCQTAVVSISRFGVYDVLLENSRAQEVLVRDMGGSPVPDAWVAASMSLGSWALEEVVKNCDGGEVYPGADPRRAYYVGKTDTEGVARLEGILPGQYFLSIFDGKVLAACELDAVEDLEVPSDRKEILALDVVGFFADYSGDRGPISTGLSTSGKGTAGTHVIEKLARVVKSRLPAHLRSSKIVCLDVADPSGRVITAKITSLIPGIGKVQAERELRPIREWHEAAAFPGEGDKIDTMEWADLDVQITDGSSKRFDSIALRLTSVGSASQMGSARVTVRSGKVARVPVSSYTVHADSAVWPGVLAGVSEAIIVRAPGQSLKLTATVPLALVTLRVRSADGTRLGMANLELSHNGVSMTKMRAWGWNDNALLLPIGQYAAVARQLNGSVCGVAEFSIDAQQSGETWVTLRN